MQKFIKYFLKNKAVTWLLLVLILAGGLFSYAKMGKLEDAPFTIKQALVLTPYPGASPSEVQSQVTDVLEEAIQSLSEDREPGWTFQDHGLREKGNPGRRDAAVMG